MFCITRSFVGVPSEMFVIWKTVFSRMLGPLGKNGSVASISHIIISILSAGAWSYRDSRQRNNPFMHKGCVPVLVFVDLISTEGTTGSFIRVRET